MGGEDRLFAWAFKVRQCLSCSYIFKGLKVWWRLPHFLFLLSFSIYAFLITFIQWYNTYTISSRRGLSPFPHCTCAQWPAVQQASALPTELRCTQLSCAAPTELRCTHWAALHPLSCAAPDWAALHPLSCAAPNWAALHPNWAALHIFCRVPYLCKFPLFYRLGRSIWCSLSLSPTTWDSRLHRPTKNRSPIGGGGGAMVSNFEADLWA